MKKLFYLLLIVVLVSVLAFGTGIANAGSGYFVEKGANSSLQYGVSGSEVTNSVYIAPGGVNYTFLEFRQLDGNFMSTGYYQGHSNMGFTTQPKYFYEYLLNGTYTRKALSLAPVGTSHRYGVYLSSYYNRASMVAFRDYNTLVSVPGFSDLAGEVFAQAESRNSDNGMNYEFQNVQYATSGLYWYPFQSMSFTDSYPYYHIKYSDTAWKFERYNSSSSNYGSAESKESENGVEFSHGTFPLRGRVVTISEAEREVPFKVILPEGMGKPSLIKLVKSENFLYIVYSKDNKAIPPDSDLYTLVKDGAIVIMEYPNKEGKNAIGTVEGILKAGESVNNSEGSSVNGSKGKNAEEKVKINGHTGVMGGNVMHCLYWFNDTTNFKISASIDTPLSCIKHIAESMKDNSGM